MRAYRLLGVLLLIFLLPATRAVQAQEFTSPYSQAELDRMLAPVALYPDSVLAQMLIAATYPLEVMEAAHWSREHPGLEGDAAVEAVEDKDWDPGVKAMVAFPDVIDRMDEHINWTTHLGDAFLQQEDQVMATIQSLREHALKEGHLKTTETVRVYHEPEVIVIEPVHPRVVYVPYYDPWVVYGHWWHPHHPPYYWSRPYSHISTSAFYWGSGINFSFGFYFSNIDWHHRHVVVHKHHRSHRHYRHDHFHKNRPGKPYYKHAEYRKNYRHWRPANRQRVHVDKRHIDHKRQQLGGRHDRQRFDRGFNRYEAGRSNHRDQRDSDLRQRLRSYRHDADNRRDRADRGPDRGQNHGTNRFAGSDRQGVRDQRAERPRNDRPHLQNNDRDRSSVQRFRTNLERQQRPDDNGVRRQSGGRNNQSVAVQRERTSERRFDSDRVRQLRQSLGNNRQSDARRGERAQQPRRDDGRASLRNNQPRPSSDNRGAFNQRHIRDENIRRDIQVRRNDNSSRRDMERRPNQSSRQSFSNAGSNRQQAASRAMESRRSFDRDRAMSSDRSADRGRDGGHRKQGMGGGGRGRDAAVAGRGGERR